MVKGNKILIGGLTILIVLGLIAFIFFPGLIESIGALITGSQNSCEDAPYQENCFCGEGERKVSVRWGGLDRWSCEVLEQLLIDPDSPTFESDAIQFTESYLTRYCGFEGANICTDLSCGNPCGDGRTGPEYPVNKCKSAVFGWSVQGARIVNMECVEITEWNHRPTNQNFTHEEALAEFGNQPNSDLRIGGGYTPWRMEFFVESKTNIPTTVEAFARANYCTDPAREILCGTTLHCELNENEAEEGDWCRPELPMNFIPNDAPFSLITPQEGFSSLGSGFPSPLN